MNLINYKNIISQLIIHSVINDNIVLIAKAFRNQFVIPDFQGFTKDIEDIYWRCKSNSDGKVASYIPQLARVNPDYWGVSICTIDGQRFGIGDTNIPFTIQSCSKPLTYALALEKLGATTVHQYVGQEPSGRNFNELVLDYNSEWGEEGGGAGGRLLRIITLFNYREAPQSHVECGQYSNLFID